MLRHYYSCYYTEAVGGNWDEEAIQALRRATRAGVTRGELGGEPQSSSSSLEATSDGAAELSEGGEGGHGSSSSGQEPSEVARDGSNSSSSCQQAKSSHLSTLLELAGSQAGGARGR